MRYLNNAVCRCRVLLIAMLMTHICSVAQELFSSGAHIVTSSSVDFVMGEYIAHDCTSASIGFLESMMYVSGNCGLLLRDDVSTQAIFDNKLQRATVYTEQPMVMQSPRYRIIGVDGRVYLNGVIYNHTQYIYYDQLPAGVYILQIEATGYKPYVARWIAQ